MPWDRQTPLYLDSLDPAPSADTINRRAVRIILECILVVDNCWKCVLDEAGIGGRNARKFIKHVMSPSHANRIDLYNLLNWDHNFISLTQIKTRMHSSRMRTDRALIVLPYWGKWETPPPPRLPWTERHLPRFPKLCGRWLQCIPVGCIPTTAVATIRGHYLPCLGASSPPWGRHPLYSETH